jgi:hypothetical protein
MHTQNIDANKRVPSLLPGLPQEVQHKPAEEKEDDDAGPEDPLVLFRSALNHADRVSADAQGICNAVQPLLRALEHVPLAAQVAQHSPASVEKLVELVRRLVHEGVLAERMRFARVVGAGGGAGGIRVRGVG